eukprot:6155008-Amphidinium_carterae.1
MAVVPHLIQQLKRLAVDSLMPQTLRHLSGQYAMVLLRVFEVAVRVKMRADRVVLSSTIKFFFHNAGQPQIGS